MLEFARKYPKVWKAFPTEESEIDALHRGYVANVIYTIVGENFTDWIDKKLKERTKRLCSERDMNISMDPEIFKIFKASTSISVVSGYYIAIITYVYSLKESPATL